MKAKLLLSILLFCKLTTFCQQHYSISSAKSSIQYLQQTSGGLSTAQRVVSIEVEFWSTTAAGNNDKNINFTIDATHSTNYTLTPNWVTPVIIGSDFKTVHQKKTINLSVTINATATFSDNEYFIIESDDDNGQISSMNIFITKDDESVAAVDKTKYDGLKPYWIETGTNLDFVDGPKLNNLTAGIFFQKLDLNFGNKGNHRWSFFAGAYESKIISTNSVFSDSVNNIINDNSFNQVRNDSLKVYKYEGKVNQTQTIRNWSFFLSPALQWGLTKGKSNDGNFHIYTSFWAELRYQEVQTTQNYGSLNLIDSFYDNIKNSANYHQSGDTVHTVGIYSHYFGLGLPIYYEDSTVNLLINPVIGISNQLSAQAYNNLALSKTGVSGNSNWKPFYFVQFRLSEKQFGITVTGEIRGLLEKNSPPQYTIALTKKFNLQKLLTFNNN